MYFFSKKECTQWCSSEVQEAVSRPSKPNVVMEKNVVGRAFISSAPSHAISFNSEFDVPMDCVRVGCELVPLKSRPTKNVSDIIRIMTGSDKKAG